MSEISELGAHYAKTLAEFYKILGPKADVLSDAVASGLRMLRDGDKEGVAVFLGVMSKDAEKVAGNLRDKSVLATMQSEVGKANARLSHLSSSLCKALAWVAKQRKGPSDKPPKGMESHYSRFIEVARETARQLSIFKSVARDMLDSHDKYAVSLARLDSVAQEMARLEKVLSGLPDTSCDEKALAQLNGEIADIALLESDLRAELSRLQDRRRQKEIARSMHAQNRLSREDWERVKRGEEPASPRFTYAKAPQAEPAAEAAAEARRQKFMENALSLFSDKLAGNATLREQLEATLPELAELYLQGKCSISGKSLFARFPKRTKHEKVFRNDANEYDVVRVGLSSINEYRLLIDVKNPRQPLIYFVGHKDECEAFMKAVPRKIADCREKALSNGVGGLFAILSPE